MQSRYFGHLAALSITQRTQLLVQLIQSTADLALAGIKQQFPGATTRALDAHLAYRRYGRAIAERYFPDVYPPAD
jgi:hypothetical protein